MHQREKGRRSDMLRKFTPRNRKFVLFWGLFFILSSIVCSSVVYVLSPSINGQHFAKAPKPVLVSAKSATAKNITIQNTPVEHDPSNDATKEYVSVDNDPKFFYGENMDMSQILPTSQHYVVNSKGQDFIDMAADLGINFVRITNSRRSFDNNEDALYTREQWNQVLDKMQSKKIKALILIETASNNPDYYTPDIRSAYLHLVQLYIDSGVFDHPYVYAVDIKNEPVLTDNNISMLQSAYTMIKEKYPNLKQTIGWWATPKFPTEPYNPKNYDWSNYAAGQKLANIVDFFSIHMYGGLEGDNAGAGLNPNLVTKQFLSQVEKGLQTQKPILIEEFGGANGDAVSDSDTIGSPESQANVYQGVYQALKEMQSSQILGAVAFDFSSRTDYQNPDAWAIVKDNGNYLFPAAYILQKYALGKDDPSLRATTVVTSQSYLLKNEDNSSTKNLHVSDRIGFKLHFDPSKAYFTLFNTEGIFKTIEVFQYNYAYMVYYAVYQAYSKGSVKISILCGDKVVYSVNINVQ
jgi:hypothetical protein